MTKEAKTYIVKSLCVMGKGKIYRAKDEVSEDKFEQGHAEKLLKDGHLALKESKKEAAKAETKAEPAKAEKSDKK